MADLEEHGRVEDEGPARKLLGLVQQQYQQTLLDVYISEVTNLFKCRICSVRCPTPLLLHRWFMTNREYQSLELATYYETPYALKEEVTVDHGSLSHSISVMVRACATQQIAY
ncbi:hypothetical protein NDU88_005220 [Pleurodeles waltl]|uniref:Uncharacterized protein n=1 Tax=Pleurodeles waltl TaxID=8319 RepID=A0AAV7RKE4_PLEWA|nr:hypothetical protein NDU88_005220 [Pleurodeles waltl]